MITAATEGVDRAASCIGACAAAAVLNAAGLPPLDLGMGFAGAMFSLGFVKPTHWGDWLNPKPADSYMRQLWLWARRIALVAFIVTGAAVFMTAFAQASPHFPLLGWTERIMPPIRSLMAGFAGTSAIPLGIRLYQVYAERRALS